MSSLPKPKIPPKKRYTDDEIRVFLLAGYSHYQIAKTYHVSPKELHEYHEVRKILKQEDLQN